VATIVSLISHEFIVGTFSNLVLFKLTGQEKEGSYDRLDRSLKFWIWSIAYIDSFSSLCAIAEGFVGVVTSAVFSFAGIAGDAMGAGPPVTPKSGVDMRLVFGVEC
jgi:hypothetical protein